MIARPSRWQYSVEGESPLTSADSLVKGAFFVVASIISWKSTLVNRKNWLIDPMLGRIWAPSEPAACARDGCRGSKLSLASIPSFAEWWTTLYNERQDGVGFFTRRPCEHRSRPLGWQGRSQRRKYRSKATVQHAFSYTICCRFWG